MKKNKTYFTTGEFAKIFGIKKQTLFHYDDCGIFKPDLVGDNGYRYYSFTQLETFALILMLRELDLPISEIKANMDKRSPVSLISLLKEKVSEIDNKILELTWSKHYIQSKIRSTIEGINAPIGQVVFENAPDEYYVISDYAGKDDEKEIVEAVGEHFAYCHSLGLYSAYPIGALIPLSSVDKDTYKYSKFYTLVLPDELKVKELGDTNSLFLDKGGNYISIYDNNGYKNIHSNCIKLMDYAREHGLSLGPHFYEDVILDDLSTQGYYNYLVKLSIKVD